jgi:GT2 family glycosyltransferase
VGQGSDKTPLKVVEDNFKNNPKIKYIHIKPTGLSYARNIGSKNSKYEIIAYIDDDAVAAPDWLEGYAEAFYNIKPVPAIVGGKLEPNWEITCPKWYPEERQFLLGIYDIGDTIKPFPEKDLPVGANFAVLKSIVEKFGGFDSRVGFDRSRKNSMIAGEDSFLSLKIKNAGYPVYYQPKAKVFHYISSSKLSRQYFLKRHYWEGITHMVIEECNSLASPGIMFGNFIWHMKGILINSVNLIKLFFIRKNNLPSSKMLILSKIAYSLGICTKSFALILKRLINSK